MSLDALPPGRREAVEAWLKTPVGVCPKCRKPVYPNSPRMGVEGKKGEHKIYHFICVPKSAQPGSRHARRASRTDW